MAIKTRPPRTISDIKTHSGRVNREHLVYRDFFQIGALELERWRREREREAATRRIDGIDSRIADINREKRTLLMDAGAFDEETESSPKKESAKKIQRGLRIRY
jgi:hypothetical protein